MKVDFIIDGFNLYHTLKHNKPTRWLDLTSFCKSYLPNISKDAKVGKIYFFSASPTHMSPKPYDPNSKVGKHKNYITVLEDTGVIVQLGRFKKKEIKYTKHNKVNVTIHKHEEKETDVAIGVKLFELMHNNADAVALVTGDTDLCPAIKAVKNNFPNKKVINILPFRSISRQLSQLCDQKSKTKEGRYLNNQLPSKITLKNGEVIEKPVNW